MTITISNLKVAANAPTGTTVGVLTTTDATGKIIPCNFMLTKKAGGYFAISSDRLITAWSGWVAAGYYPVVVRANGINDRFGERASFTITVLSVDPPPPPTPNGITFIPTSASLPDNAVAGTTVAALSVSMSDGSAFSGRLAAIPADMVAVVGNARLVLARGLSPTDRGSHQCVVTATQSGGAVSGSIRVEVTAASPPPPP